MQNSSVEWTRRPDGGAVDLEILKRKSWPGITAHSARIAAPATYELKLDGSQNCIALRDLYRVDGATLVSGAPPSFVKDLRGKLVFAPAGCTIESWTKIDKPASIIVVTIDDAASNRHSADLKQLSPLVDFDDPMLRSVMMRFQAILDDPSLDVPGYVETLTDLLVFDLTRATNGQAKPQGSQSGLSVRQFRLVTEYMDGHLHEKLPITELAALVRLTRFHFIRAFKQTAGVPPHQFLVRRRVERAKELLAEQPHTSIAEVADRTGFGTPVQMTRAFRRVLGTTPSAIRRS